MSSSTAPEPRATPSDADPAVRRVGVVGGGVMGAGIAQVLALAGCSVVLLDPDAAAAKRAEETIRRGPFGLDAALGRGRITTGEATDAAERITYVTGSAELGPVDLVVEAVPEDLALKIAVFRDLDRTQPGHCVLASNSSGLPIAALAAATDRPDRVIGWHWASPAPAMRLAEIVRTPVTSDATVERVVALATRARKHPVVVQDAPTTWGYVANRVYAAAHREAERVVADGVATPEQVDLLLVDCFRWPVGPFGMSRGAGSGWTA